MLEEKSKLSKGKEIEYNEYKIQSYLTPGYELSTDDICMILKCRIRDLNVKGNFPNAYRDTKCIFPLCTSYESQSHLASCEFYDNHLIIPEGLIYEDIFISDVKKQHKIMNILAKRCKIQNQLSDENLAARCEPVDPRKENRPVRGITSDNTRSTSRQALSLVIRV